MFSRKGLIALLTLLLLVGGSASVVLATTTTAPDVTVCAIDPDCAAAMQTLNGEPFVPSTL